MADWTGAQSNEHAFERRASDLLPPALTGLLAGWILWYLAERRNEEEPFLYALTVVLAFLFAFLWRRDRFLTGLALPPVLATALCAPLIVFRSAPERLNETAFNHEILWIFTTIPVVGLLFLALAFAGRRSHEISAGGFSVQFFDGIVRMPIILALAGVFTGIMWALAFLWGAMFDLIKLDFILEMLDEMWFALPFTGAVAGVGIAVVRGWGGFVALIKHLFYLAACIIAPVLSFFALTFLAALPVTGLNNLWETPSAFGLAGAVTLVMCAAIAGVRLGESHGQPARWLRWSTGSLICTTPLYTTLALLALWLRIDQYGLTPARVVFLVFGLMLLAYCMTLVAAFVTGGRQQSGRWMTLVDGANLVAGLSIGAVVVLFHTPVIDPLSLTAKSQFKRFQGGDDVLTDKDIRYLRFSLGQPGKDALSRLEGEDQAMRTETIRRDTHIAIISSYVGEFDNARRFLEEIDGLEKQKHSVYQISLPGIRFDAGPYGQEMLSMLRILAEHPEVELIRAEVKKAANAADRDTYYNYWESKRVVELLRRKEKSYRELPIRCLRYWGLEGEKAEAELQLMTDHADYEEIIKALNGDHPRYPCYRPDPPGPDNPWGR